MVKGSVMKKDLMSVAYFATPSFFTLFDFKLKNSSSSNPLNEPSSIVITEEVANKFFGDTDPIGKVIVFENFGNLKVTGVFPKTKQKSHLQFEALVSSSTLSLLEKEGKSAKITDNWEDYYQNYVYVLLDKNARQSDLDTALAKISKLKYYDNEKVNLSILQYSYFKHSSRPAARK